MLGRAMILKQAALFGLTCSVVAPVTYVAHDRIAKAVTHRVPVKHKRHAPARARAAAPVCPPSGIATISALPDLSRPLVAMDSDFEDAVLSGSTMQSAARSPWGGAVQASSIGFVRPGGAGGIGTAPPAAGTPVAKPTDEAPVSALPEPKTWLFMLAGFALTGAVLRGRHERRSQVAA
jgi:hypothetical protein